MAQRDTENASRAGRKRASSREMLEEAASELFLEHGYAGTTIEQIAQRAGVSRNTFFNYFDAKSDLLWGGVDTGIHALTEELARTTRGQCVVDEVRGAIIRAAARFGPGQLPLAATQYEAMGAFAELAESGLSRFLGMAVVVERYLAARLRPTDAEAARTLAYALVAATVSAAGAWARAGVSRGQLDEYVRGAITPICEGFKTALGRWSGSSRAPSQNR
ncbi:MAG: TetR/AcrR family transcriptional regulator [Microbacteriaceae bacterium]